MPPLARGTFASEKISAVRWIGEGGSERLATGGRDCDSGAGRLRLWREFRPDDEDEGDLGDLGEVEGRLEECAGRPVGGDVTALSEALAGLVLVGDSFGAVRLVDWTGAERRLWPRLHVHPDGSPAACSAVATLDGDVATVGEDGRINLFALPRPDAVRTAEPADACSLLCAAFLKHNEIVAGNSRGRMKVWDLRALRDGPVATLPPSGDPGAATCVGGHPARRHLVLAGGESGAVAAWDLRADARPVSLVEAHEAAVADLRFHPDRPDALFTCSAAGELWRWNSDDLAEGMPSPLIDRPGLRVRSLMPDLHQSINAIDCRGDRLACGCDNEAFYIISDIFS